MGYILYCSTFPCYIIDASCLNFLVYQNIHKSHYRNSYFFWRGKTKRDYSAKNIFRMFGTRSVVYAQMSFHIQLRNENQEMKSAKIKETLAIVSLAMDHIKDPTTHEIISLLHNLVEDMHMACYLRKPTFGWMRIWHDFWHWHVSGTQIHTE